MIDFIEIRNFQIHKRSRIDFDPGITIIAGTSDNGKSSIIRAFRWCFNNRPQGYSFRRWGTPEKSITAVDVSVDGEVISRKRGNVKNEYHFSGDIYKALRADVPEPILDHLKILPFNLQLQNDTIFLFQNSDSEVAKMINDVSGISIIDDILKETNRRLRELNSEEKILTGLIADKKIQMSSYKVFVGLKERVYDLQEKGAIVSEKQEALEDIEESLDRIRTLRAKKKRLPDCENLLERLDRLPELNTKISSSVKFFRELEGFISVVEQTPKISGEEIESLQKRIEALVLQFNRTQKLKETINELEEDLDQLEFLTNTKKDNSRKLKGLEKELEDLKEEAGVCPMCEKEW